MSLHWVEGFEARRADFYMNRLYAATAGSYVSGVTPGRKIGGALQSSNYQLLTNAIVSSTSAIWYQHVAVKKADGVALGGTAPGFRFRNTDGVQCSLAMVNAANGSGDSFRWELRRGISAAVIDTSGEFAAGSNSKAWHLFILKVNLGTGGADGSYELRHYDQFGSGTVVFSGGSVDLSDQTSTGIDRVELLWADQNIAMDDWLVWDDVNSPSGTAFQDAFPSKPFIILETLPDGDGNSSDWRTSSGGTHWVLIDDDRTSTVGDDTTFVETDAVSDIDLFTYTDIDQFMAPTGPVVRAVAVDTMAAMNNSGTRTCQVRVRSGGSEADQGTAISVTGLSLLSFLRIMEDNPVTSVAWTVSTVDSVEIGVRLAS